MSTISTLSLDLSRKGYQPMAPISYARGVVRGPSTMVNHDPALERSSLSAIRQTLHDAGFLELTGPAVESCETWATESNLALVVCDYHGNTAGVEILANKMSGWSHYVKA